MDTIFMDYESLLMGQRKDIGLYNFFGAEPGGANQQRALIVIRYAIEKVRKSQLIASSQPPPRA